MHSSISSSSSVAAAEQERISPGLRRMLRQLPVFFAVAIGGLILLELGLRLAGVSYPNLGMPHPETGWALRPGTSGWIREENKAGVAVTINSDGLRDREHSITKPEGTLRIAVLGNSYTEAMQVPLEQTYWAVMERELARAGLAGVREVEVINFGVGGFGTAQELITLRTKVWKYQPDIVVLAFLTGNDVLYNHRDLNQQPQAPYFVYRNGRLVLDDSFRSIVRNSRFKDLQAAVERSSVVVQTALHVRTAFKQWVYTLRQRLSAAKQEFERGGNADVSSDPNDITVVTNHNVYVPPRNQVWEEAWRVTEGLIRLMRDEVESHGARFVIATLTNAPQVHPDERVRQRFAAKLGVPDLNYPDQRIRQFAEREHIASVHLVETMAPIAAAKKNQWHGFGGSAAGHWNEAGNRIAGEIIAARLTQMLRENGVPQSRTGWNSR
jgi:hypothetical protein